MAENIALQVNKHTLSGLVWKAENTRAVMCLIHGLGEYCERYEHVAAAMNNKGISVFSVDLPGHGRSTGKRGHSTDKELTETVKTLRVQAISMFPGMPCFIYGHSMGGNISLRHILKFPTDFKAAIITSPWIELAVKPPVIKYILGRVMHKIFPSFTDNTKLNPDFISRVKEEVIKYREDPLIHDSITTELFFTIANNGRWILDSAPKLEIPLLLMHGTGDQITSYKSCQKFADKNPELVELRLWDDGYHELHNDKISEEVITFASDWIARRI